MLIINNDQLPCKGLLLDFDGTLIDSDPALVDLWVDVCKEKNSPVNSDHIGKLVQGRPATKIIVDLFPGIEQNEITAILKELEAKEEVALYKMMEGACDFLHAVSSLGITLGIVTSSWQAKVWNVLNRYNIGHLFSVIVTREEVSNLKPDPEPYILAEKLIGINRNNLLAVEDSRTGIVSAKAAGMRCIGYGTESLIEHGADIVIPAFGAIKLASSPV